MDEQLIYKLIELVESASGAMWEIALRQVYVLAAMNIFWAAALTIATYVLYRAFMRCTAWAEKSDWDDYLPVLSMSLSFAGAIISPIMAMSNLHLAIVRFANPEYYAIKIIVELSGTVF